MAGPDYVVSARNLNLRSGAGVEAPVIAVLPLGAVVEYIADAVVAGWWQVQASGQAAPGYVARQYLAPVSGGVAPLPPVADDVLWRATDAAIGHVAYKLGAKHSADGAIDCSGWVGEITRAAFDAVNQAAAPDIVFHAADYRLFDTHSDGIVTGVEARTGRILNGPQVTLAALRPGMLIGCNFGDKGRWKLDKPPRVYGIDHIVEVMSDPASGALYISQSSDSGHGVNRVPLPAWLADRAPLVAQGRIHAVDPFALADRNTAYVRNLMGAPAPSAAPSPAVPTPARTDNPRLAAFGGRGFYVYSAEDVVRLYGSANAAVAEIKRCKADYIWVRIHGWGYVGEAKGSDGVALRALIAAAKTAGVRVGGWGWCQGDSARGDADTALRALGVFGLDAYVADIEQGVNGANWSPDEVNTFLAAVRASHDGPFCVTSHGLIDLHPPVSLFDGAARAGVDCLNPQAYWLSSFPTEKILDFVHAPAGQYKVGDPASYALLCHDRWVRYRLPIVIAGSTTPDTDFGPDEIVAKLKTFLAEFTRPKDLAGVCFWHFGATPRPACDLLAAG